MKTILTTLAITAGLLLTSTPAHAVVGEPTYKAELHSNHWELGGQSTSMMFLALWNVRGADKVVITVKNCDGQKIRRKTMKVSKPRNFAVVRWQNLKNAGSVRIKFVKFAKDGRYDTAEERSLRNPVCG